MFKLVYITVPSVSVGETLAKTLLEHKAAACVNIIPTVTSMYWWEEKIQKDQEALLLVKTTKDRIESLKNLVKTSHPYDVPEVLTVNVDEQSSSTAYLEWLQESTK